MRETESKKKRIREYSRKRIKPWTGGGRQSGKVAGNRTKSKKVKDDSKGRRTSAREIEW